MLVIAMKHDIKDKCGFSLLGMEVPTKTTETDSNTKPKRVVYDNRKNKKKNQRQKSVEGKWTITIRSSRSY